MGEAKTIQLGKRVIQAYQFTGQVLDSQRSSETQVTSHQNGQVTSSATHYNEIFLRDAGGKEMNAEIGASGVGTRVGNRVTVTWGVLQGKESGPFTTVYNHDTQRLGHIAKGVNDLSGPPGYNMLIIVLVFVFVFNVVPALTFNFGSILMVAASVGLFVWILKRRKILRGAMEGLIQK